jgi:hypothetical protein
VIRKALGEVHTVTNEAWLGHCFRFDHLALREL